MEANATAELAARTAAAAKQPRPERPHLEPRRSERERKPVDPVYDVDKSGKGQPGWSDYERSRAGSQHGRMRDESYSEVQAARDKLRKQVDEAKREHGELAAALDSVYSSLQRLVAPDGLAAADVDCEVPAALLLRAAIAELVEDYERMQADTHRRMRVAATG